LEEEIDASDPSALKMKSLHPKVDKGSKARKTLAPKKGDLDPNSQNYEEDGLDDPTDDRNVSDENLDNDSE
jgi:hypothetical protein